MIDRVSVAAKKVVEQRNYYKNLYLEKASAMLSLDKIPDSSISAQWKGDKGEIKVLEYEYCQSRDSGIQSDHISNSIIRNQFIFTGIFAINSDIFSYNFFNGAILSKGNKPDSYKTLIINHGHMTDQNIGQFDKFRTGNIFKCNNVDTVFLPGLLVLVMEVSEKVSVTGDFKIDLLVTKY